jgi:3-dehydroquinate synthetase
MGTFYSPSKIIIDIGFLDSLPQREYQSGIAEMIKCAIIADPEFFSWLEKNIDALLERDEAVLLYAIEKTCALKIKIVNQDPFDNVEIRAQLNLGHTFGHAIETLTDLEKYLHGEAVAIGGLALNDVGRSHFLLKHAGIPKDRQEHILLLVNQDLRRFNDIKVHLERMAKATESHHEANHFADYDSWHEESAWYDDDWSYDDYYDDYYDNYSDYD